MTFFIGLYLRSCSTVRVLNLDIFLTILEKNIDQTFKTIILSGTSPIDSGTRIQLQT